MNIIPNFLRTIMERQIDHSIDTGKPLFVWARWLISFDESLVSYEKKMRAVDSRLHSEAIAYLASVHKTEKDKKSPQTVGILKKSAYHDAEYSRVRSKFRYYRIMSSSVVLIGIFLTWHHFSASKLEITSHTPLPSDIVEQEQSQFSEKLYQSQKQIRESLAAEFSPLTYDLASFPNLTVPKNMVLEYSTDTKSRDKLIDLIAESNPLCAYVVTCYVTPTLE